MEEYQLLQRQGVGSYAVVWKARRRADGRIVAIKQLKEVGVPWETVMQTPDVHFPKRLAHANILRLLSLVRLQGSTYIVMEFCDVNLYQVCQAMVTSGKAFTEPEIRWIMRRLLQGVACMAGAGVMHRDIKPENILFAADQAGGGNPQLKICDFGQAKQTGGGGALTDYVSTRWYRAPEVLLRCARYGPAVDVWACGAVMAELFTLRPLFPGASEADQLFRVASVLGGITGSAWPEGLAAAREHGIALPPEVRRTGLAAVLPRASPAAVAAIEAMLTYNPSARPSAEAVLTLPFFTGAGGSGTGGGSGGGSGGEACPARYIAPPPARHAEEAAARAEAEAENGRLARMLAAESAEGAAAPAAGAAAAGPAAGSGAEGDGVSPRGVAGPAAAGAAGGAGGGGSGSKEADSDDEAAASLPAQLLVLLRVG